MKAVLRSPSHPVAQAREHRGPSGPSGQRTPPAAPSNPATRGPIRHGRATGRRPIQALTPCMPCSFALLPFIPGQRAAAQPDGPLRVTVSVRWIPLVTAACGTRVARRRERRRSHLTATAPARLLGEADLRVTTASWARARRGWRQPEDSNPAPSCSTSNVVAVDVA